MFKQVCLFTFALFLSACAVDASQTAQNLPTPTVLVLPTETVNRIPIATEQSTVIPVSTPIGTETPARLYYELMRSPNSEYEAVRFEEDAQPMNIQTIQIQDKKGQPIQVITYQPSLGDPHPSLRLLTWSPDSTELFYFYEFHSDGYWTLTDGNDLRAINLKTGEIREIVNGWGIGLAVSPKGDNLAYIQNSEIVLLDLSSGEKQVAEIASQAFEQAGKIVWAPDGNGLVFQLLLDSDGNGELIYLDTHTMLQKTILTYLLDEFEFQEWSSDSQQIMFKLKDHVQMIGLQFDK